MLNLLPDTEELLSQNRAARKQNRTVGKRESSNGRGNAEAEQREQLITGKQNGRLLTLNSK